MLRSKSPKTVKLTLALLRRIANFGVQKRLSKPLDYEEEAFFRSYPKPGKAKSLEIPPMRQYIRRLKLARADLVFAPAAVGGRLLADLAEGNQISDEFRDLLEGGEVR